jgi:hypothetical protein
VNPVHQFLNGVGLALKRCESQDVAEGGGLRCERERGEEEESGTYWWNEVIWDIVSSQNWDPRVNDRVIFHITLSHQFQVEH